MTRKTRFIVFLICLALFVVIAPYIILYSLGYRIDIRRFNITATGGMYVRALPQGATITIDSLASQTTGLFSPSVFRQNLLPGPHTVTIKKDGYFDYQKNLEVLDQSVTKLENVILMKQQPRFTLLQNNVQEFYPSPDEKNILLKIVIGQKINYQLVHLENNQTEDLLFGATGNISSVAWSGDSSRTLVRLGSNYFLVTSVLQNPKITVLALLTKAEDASFNPENPNEIFFVKNKNLYSNQQTLPLIKNIAAWHVANNSISWLSQDGFLYTSTTRGIVINTLTKKPFPIKTEAAYKILRRADMTFLQENQSLFLLDSESEAFKNFYSSVHEIITSPDGQKILYQNDHEILLSKTHMQNPAAVFLNRFSDTINEAQWLGNDYVIFTLRDAIAISEIDTRGNVNTVTLPQKALLTDENLIDIKSPDIFFNQQDKKLYLLSEGGLLVSERLVP